MKRNNSILLGLAFVLAILACQQVTPIINNGNETQLPSTDVAVSTSAPSKNDIYTPLVSDAKISENPELVKELIRLGEGEINGEIIFSPNRQLLAVPSTLGVRLFNSTTLEEVKFIESNSLNYLVAFSPDSKKIVSVLVKDKTISNYDVETGELICENILSHEGEWFNPQTVSEIEFTPDGQYFVTKGLAGVYIFDSTTCNEIKFIESEATSLWLAISPDGEKLASSTDRQIVSIWKIPAGELISTLKLSIGLDTNIISGAFSSDSQQFATSTDLGPFQMWDVATGKMLNNLGETTHGESYIRGYFSKDGLLLETGDKFELWDVLSKEKRYSNSLNLQKTSNSSLDYYSKDGEIYVTFLQYGKPILTWDVATGNQISSLEWNPKGTFGITPSDNISFTSGQFVSSPFVNGLRIWDFNSGEYTLIQTIENRDTVSNAAISPDGNKIAISFLGKDGVVEIWDIGSGQLNYTLEINSDGSVGSFVFSPDSQELASSSFPKEIKLWDVNTGELKKSISATNGVITSALSGGNRDRFAYSPDGTKIATRNINNEIDVWDTTTGELSATLQTGDWSFNLTFSPDGQFLASTEDSAKKRKSAENTIKIWDVNTGELIKILENTLLVTNIAFSPDGKQLAAASHTAYRFPATILLWDLDSETVKQTLSGHTMRIDNLSYLLEGKILASSSSDGTIRIWGVP